jgi:DNA-binding CsgD family transcriptional regulator
MRGRILQDRQIVFLGLKGVKILKKFAKKLSISIKTQRAAESNREQMGLG